MAAEGRTGVSDDELVEDDDSKPVDSDDDVIGDEPGDVDDVGDVDEAGIERSSQVRVPEPESQLDLGRYESFAEELVRFLPLPEPTKEEAELARDIVVLDHRSLHALDAFTPERAEVKALLRNAVITAGFGLVEGNSYYSGDRRGQAMSAAVGLYRQAHDIFELHLQSRNRIRYMLGVLIGTAFLGVCGAVAFLAVQHWQLMPRPVFVLGLMAFAGCGSVVSVLMRISNLDVVREISRSVLLISGFGRPVVAGAFAVVTYLMLSSGLVTIAAVDRNPARTWSSPFCAASASASLKTSSIACRFRTESRVAVAALAKPPSGSEPKHDE